MVDDKEPIEDMVLVGIETIDGPDDPKAPELAHADPVPEEPAPAGPVTEGDAPE